MRKKLIEVALPLEAINAASAREKSIRHGHPSTLHLWWARRPLAACRAVLFGQLVDDPSSWPELFPTEAAEDAERQRLFRIIEQLVLWENSTNEAVIGAARLEIARSVARNRKADGEGTDRDDAVLADRVVPEVVNAYLAEVAPPVHDPFAGGGSIPLEAQRLGLRAIATDLNPVAVLINKALIEIPPKFAGMPPVNPESRKTASLRTWKGAEGLAEDVRYYGKWMRDEAWKRIGHLYPQVDLPPEHGGGKATVIAWLWARTVESPDPAFRGVQVPLVSSFWLSKRPGRLAWIEPVVDTSAKAWRFQVRTGAAAEKSVIDAGTKLGRGATFRCILSGAPISGDYIKREAQAGRMGSRLMAVAAEGNRARIYITASETQEAIASRAAPKEGPDTSLPDQALGFRVQNYGMRTHRDLFTLRQLAALREFVDLVTEARELVREDAARNQGGRAKTAVDYADAVGTYLAFGVSKMLDRMCALCFWDSSTSKETSTNVFSRHALCMSWDYAENNPFSNSSGNFSDSLKWIPLALEQLLVAPAGSIVGLGDAVEQMVLSPSAVNTDPPYYDNVPYADLSDFFYVWLRLSLATVWPELFETILVAKDKELIAEPFRYGGKSRADELFVERMEAFLRHSRGRAGSHPPVVVYYAFRQSEGSGDSASTGWESFLSSVCRAGLLVNATWPVRTETTRQLKKFKNALASSVVLACRMRADDAAAATRGDFRRALRAELPSALRALQKGNIAPVDLAQASIGPGMAVFSRYSKVVEADGSAMSVRTALQLINEALDEHLAEQSGEMGPDTRFAVTWFETRGFEAGPFGEAETLAKARNVSVSGIVEAGIVHAAAGKVRLLRRDELPEGWDPTADSRLTVWEATQHLIKRLEAEGEQAAAELLAALGDKAEAARDLAYRLYLTCERKGWAEEARAYNGLVVAWPELKKLASARRAAPAAQPELF